MLSDSDFKRIYWHSRRGMLELDLLLLPFVENCLRDLDGADQVRYTDLLECEDTELFAWLLGHGSPSNPAHAASIEQILAACKRKLPQ